MKLGTRLSALTLLLASATAQAQTPAQQSQQPAEEVPRGETVMDRPRPEYDALGIRMDGFLLYPTFAVRQVFNSNIFATERKTRSDFITIAESAVDLRSDWNNHSLAFHADAAIARYWEETTENYEDFTFGASGRLDVSRQTQIFADMGYRRRHEARSSPDDVGGREPAEYSVAYALLGLKHSFNRLSFRLDGTVDRYDYYDTPAFVGGKIDQDGRDRDQIALKLRTAYEFAPLREVYFLTNVNQRRYRQDRDGAGVDRDSEGFEAGAGIKYDLTGITFIDFYLGYSQQNYQDSSLKTVRGLSGALKLTWNVTRLTTVTGQLSREIEESTVMGSSSYFATKGEVRVDHELLRNLIVTGYAAYQNDSFEGISRDDNYFRIGFGARYLIDRNFSAEAGYSYRARDSNLRNNDFDENLAFFRLVGKL